MKKKHRKTLEHWWSYPNLKSLYGGWRHRRQFEQVETFVLFVGYPRSGHSLVGSLLDAHPNMVIANQLDALTLFKHNYSREQIFYLIWENTKILGELGRNNSGYNYKVPHQWQGSSTEIRVIGDKRGGKSARLLSEQEQRDDLLKIPTITDAKLKLIHVVRNPYDNISTMVRRAITKRGIPYSVQLFTDKLASYHAKAAANDQLMQHPGLSVKTVYLEDLIEDPAATLHQLCTFLQVPSEESYLQDCAAIIWPQANKSRFKADFWTAENIESVKAIIEQFPFLQRYSYESL